MFLNVVITPILLILISLVYIIDFRESLSINKTLNLKVLQNFALSKINIDRLSFGLNLVSLSDNKAAQHHASEILQSGFLSHWSTNGLKPYMVYSLYNGTGYIQQNTGQISYINTDEAMKGITSHSFCTRDSELYCEPLDPFDAIDKLENSMMYNDSFCCNDGHKNTFWIGFIQM